MLFRSKNWAVQRLLRKRPPAYSRKHDRSGIRLFTLNQYSPDKLLEFSKEIPDENVKDAAIMDYQKARPVLSTLMLAAFFALFVPFSSTKVRFFNPADKTLVVNFKYISTPIEYEQNTSTMKHMQSATPVVKKRSPVELKITDASDGKVLFEHEYKPRGLRNDIAMFIYTQINVEADRVNVELRETEGGGKTLNLNDVMVIKGDGTFVILKDGKMEVAAKNE